MNYQISKKLLRESNPICVKTSSNNIPVYVNYDNHKSLIENNNPKPQEQAFAYNTKSFNKFPDKVFHADESSKHSKTKQKENAKMNLGVDSTKSHNNHSQKDTFEVNRILKSRHIIEVTSSLMNITIQRICKYLMRVIAKN